MKDYSKPAFPSGNEVKLGDMITAGHAGTSLRDYFAAQALVALFNSEANPRVGRGVQPYNNSPEHREYVAREAYAIADAMLVERSA